MLVISPMLQRWPSRNTLTSDLRERPQASAPLPREGDLRRSGALHDSGGKPITENRDEAAMRRRLFNFAGSFFPLLLESQISVAEPSALAQRRNSGISDRQN
jgi:hypothetical protein